MDISHYIQLGWKRMASQIRIPKISHYYKGIENYSKFAIYLGTSITLAVLSYQETKKNTLDTWLESNSVKVQLFSKWIEAYGYIESQDTKLIRAIIKTVPYEHRKTEIFLAKNGPIAVVFEPTGEQKIFTPKNYSSLGIPPMDWVAYRFTWDKIVHVFEHLNQQLDNFNKIPKTMTKVRPTDPYELHY